MALSSQLLLNGFMEEERCILFFSGSGLQGKQLCPSQLISQFIADVVHAKQVTGFEPATVFPQKITAVNNRFAVLQGTTQEEIYKQQYWVIPVLYTTTAATSSFLFLAVFTFGYDPEGQNALVSVFNAISELSQESIDGGILQQ
jgi:hypothetical protein